MPKIGIQEKPYYNTDSIANALAPDDIFNCYLEAVPNLGYSIRRRPGLVEFGDVGSGIPSDGIFEWEAAGLVLVVNNGQIYKLTSTGSLTTITTDPLISGTPVIFSDGAKADSTPFLYMANGKLVYSLNGTNTLYPTDAGTPSTATHVTFLNLKFLANVPGTNQFLFTDVNPAGPATIDPLYWSSSDNPLTAESKGDNLVYLGEHLQEILAGGSQGMEIWQDDGVTPFSPLPQAASKIGIEAPYSVAFADNAFFSLSVIDGVRCVTKMTGRVPQVISEPIANILHDYTTVSDAIGTIVGEGGIHIYLLQFPTEGKTWAYDIKNDVWTPWGTLNKTSGMMEQFIGRHSVFVKMWNKHLITSNRDGKIYEFDRKVYTDGVLPLKSYRRTTWLDHGDGRRKKSKRLRIKIKRGETSVGAVYLRFRDNGNKEWSPYIELPMTPEGDRDFIADLSRLGQYHSRQYEFSITDAADLCIVWADEEVELLRF